MSTFEEVYEKIFKMAGDPKWNIFRMSFLVFELKIKNEPNIKAEMEIQKKRIKALTRHQKDHWLKGY